MEYNACDERELWPERSKLTAGISTVLILFILAWMPAHAYQLGSGDEISIIVAGSPEFSVEGKIGPDGTIGVPYLGQVNLEGRTARETENHLATLFQQRGLLVDPQVAVTVTRYRSRMVTVTGEVHKPGQYALEGESSLIDVIARAGGLNARGADHFFLVRNRPEGRKRYQLTFEQVTSGEYKDVRAQAGDVIVVPKQPVFYIEGAINNPGQYPLETDLTVMQAIAIGGGLTPRGSYSGLEIHRKTDNGEVKELEADLKESLKPNDVLFVKERWF